MGQSNSKKVGNNQKKNEKTAEVLYQRLGNRWYAFSCINDEVFVGSISEDEMDTICVEETPALNPNHALHR